MRQNRCSYTPFFDSIDHDLLLRAVEGHADAPWVMLCVRRWLVPLVLPDGSVQARNRGTPQGSAISPVLANLFLPEGQARRLARQIADRMVEVGLHLHPAGTRIVYCKDGNRRRRYPHTAFTFLGFTFRTRPARAKNGAIFGSFQPAISRKALKRLGGEVRRWRLHHRIGYDISQVARRINPIVQGWMQYYGAFYRSALNPLLQRINGYIMRWLRKKYRRLRNTRRAAAAWQGIVTPGSVGARG